MVAPGAVGYVWFGHLTSLSGRYESILQQFNDAVKTSGEQKALIAQLEDDLRKVNALSVMFRGDAEVMFPAISRHLQWEKTTPVLPITRQQK